MASVPLGLWGIWGAGQWVSPGSISNLIGDKEEAPIKVAAPVPEGARYYLDKGIPWVISCSIWSSSTVSEVVGAQSVHLFQPLVAWFLTWAVGGILRLDSPRAASRASEAAGAPKSLAASGVLLLGSGNPLSSGARDASWGSRAHGCYSLPEPFRRSPDPFQAPGLSPSTGSDYLGSLVASGAATSVGDRHGPDPRSSP